MSIVNFHALHLPLLEQVEHSQDAVMRLFQLQAGEVLTCKGTDQLSFIYVFQGSVEITIQQKTVLDQWTYLLPSHAEAKIEAQEDSVIYHLDANKLDVILSFAEIDQAMMLGQEVSFDFRHILHSPVLRILPTALTYQLLSQVQRRLVDDQEVIINQGENGEEFYLIESGEAEVWRKFADQPAQLVAVLKAGDLFGEEALITGGQRNATVKMSSTGVLLVGDRQLFKEVVEKPAIKEAEAAVVKTMLEEGYHLLDVRQPAEFAEGHIPGARLIPLPELRQRSQELDPNEKYVVQCGSGLRSAVAAMILAQRGFKEVISLAGGLRVWPFEIIKPTA